MSTIQNGYRRVPPSGSQSTDNTAYLSNPHLFLRLIPRLFPRR